MSLEALAGLCCDVEALTNNDENKINDDSPSPPKESPVLTRVPLSRHTSNENTILPTVPLTRNSSNDTKFMQLSRNASATTDSSLVSPPLLSRQASNNRFLKIYK